MRTKNLNLKKKLAFIASVAMIASTAAYLPADFAKDIGISTGIVAEAADPTGAGEIDTFTAYVKINNRYVAAAASDGEFKLYRTLAEAKADNTTLLTLNKTTGLTASNAQGFNIESGANDKFDASATPVSLPTTTAPGSTITIEVAAKSSASVVSAVSTIEVTLDDHGMAVVPKQSSLIEVQGDNYKAAVGTQGQEGYVAASGDREFIDLTDLQFEVNKSNVVYTGFSNFLNESVTRAFSATTGGENAKTIEAATAANQNKGFKEVVTNAPKDDPDAKSYQYAWTKSGNEYVRNFVGTLSGEAAPQSNVTVDLGYLNNWNPSGAGITTENGKKVLKLTLGSDGTATSGVISFTKNDVTEKVIITVLNADSNMDNTKLEVVKGNLGIAVNGNDTAFGTTAKALDKTTAASAYKITSEKKVQAINGSNQFVTVYTVANNLTATTVDKIAFKTTYENGVEFAEAGTAKVKFVSKTDGEDGKTTLIKYVTNGNTTIESDTFEVDNKVSGLPTATSGDKDAPDNETINGAKYKNIKVVPETGKGANAKTPVMVFNSAFFQFDITTSYEIPVDFQKTENGKDVKGKTTVTGTTVTKPEEPTKAGYTFDQFSTAPNTTDGQDGTKIFAAGVAQQQNTDVVNPNITLYAQYKENQYNITLNGNNGYFTGEDIDSYTKTAFGTFNNVSQATTITQTIKSGDENTKVLNLDKDDVLRPGYQFVGFSTKANGTKDDVVKFDDFDTIRPAAANGSLTLYAVWEADTKTITFKALKLDGTGTTDKENLATTYTGATAAEFAPGTNTTVSVKMGEAYGTLPTPVKKGYEFVGWYLKKDTTPGVADTDKYSAVSVSAARVLSYDDLDAGELVLYAKFRQAKYNLTFDLDGGAFVGSTGTNFKEISYYKVNGGADGAIEFYDEDNKKIVFGTGEGEVSSAIYDAKKGSGAYFEFKGWNIGASTEKVATKDLASKIKQLSTASDLTIKAVFEASTMVSGQGYYALDLNKGSWYSYDSTAADKKYYKSYDGVSIEIAGTKGADVAETFNNNIVTETNNKKYALMRPGYTFTGWYLDEECTQAFDFSTAKYPDETEVTLYAGWKPVTTTSYTLKCLLVDGDGSIVTSADGNSFPWSDIESNEKIYVGATGSTADASKMSITYNGKKYVFDSERSAEYETSAEIKAEWKTGEGFEPGENAAAKLVAVGTTEIYGVFAEEGTVEKTLGTATNVKADNGTVTFTAAANAHHYRVQKTWTVNGVEKTAVGAKFTTTTGTYNVPTGDYKIAIIAYSDDAETASTKYTISDAVEVKGAAVTLGKATNLNVKDGTVTFTAAAGADHYRVQKTYTVNGTTKTAKGSKFTTTTGTFGVPEGDYKIAIIAYADAAETQFTVSDAKEVKAATIDLEAVDTASITVNRGTGEVSWTASKGAKEYVVFKIVKENGKSKIYGGKRTSDTTYKFANFPTDDFKVYIASIDANENKVFSATKKISTLPSATNVKVSDDYKTVSWTKATGDKADKIVKYQVAKFDSTTNKYSYGTKVDASQSSFTLGVKAKVGQQIFVIAFDADGNSSYSDAITVK